MLLKLHWQKQEKSDSEIQIKDKQDFFHVLTDRNVFTKILQQADDTFYGTEFLREISAGNHNNYIIDYFMRIKEHIDLNGLRFY